MTMKQLDCLTTFVLQHNRLPLYTETEAIERTGIAAYINNDRKLTLTLHGENLKKNKHPHNQEVAMFA